MSFKNDEEQINELAVQFFDLFTNTNGRIPKVRAIENLFIPEGILINNTSDETAVYDLESFIQPREELLLNGDLNEFSEWEVESQTMVRNNIAQRICRYEKSGELNGERFEGKGTKMMQFVKKNNRWLFSCVVWADE